MNGVTQTIFGDGSEGAIPGNCLQAAIATLLDKQLDEVPHFVADGDDWWMNLLAWMKANHYHLTYYAERFNDRLDYAPDHALSIDHISELPSGKAVIATGLANRGFQHSVVWQAGSVVFDPHPSRSGFVEAPTEFYLIERA